MFLCSKLVSSHGFVHLSTGDLFRDVIKSGTPKGDEIKKIIDEGKMIPGDTAAELLKDEMEKHTKDAKEPVKFLIDGFPRTEDNISGWDKILKDQSSLLKVLYLNCSEEIMTTRIKERAKADGSEARSDDNEETLKKRFEGF